jgi:hypothetical protein
MRQPFPHGDLVKDLGKMENTNGRLTDHHNVKRYPFDFVHRLRRRAGPARDYGRMPFAVSASPKITETSGGNCMLARCTDPLFGDGVWSGDELSAAAPSKPLGNERAKGSVP